MPRRARPLLATVAIAASIGSGAASARAATPIAKGPYIQRLAAGSVEVRVELSKPAAASLELDGDGEIRRTLDDPAVTDFHLFAVSKLTPSRRYRYRVHVGQSTSDGGEFVTAPPDESQRPFSFILYGDNRTDGPTHAAVLRAMGQESFDFLVHTGDFVQTGGGEAFWQDFFDIERSVLRDRCVFACVGNHELFDDNEAAHFARYFGPGAAGGSAMKPYSSFRWGNTRFLLLNTFEDWTGDERTWLDRELAHADAEPGLAWRVAVIHHSPWAAGPHGNNARMLAAGIDDLLVSHHVDVVLAGHDHIYERGEAKGLKYVVSGGGGAPLYRELSPKPSTRKVESAYHYVLFEVSTDRMAITARRMDGSVIEQCSFGHGSSWGCDAKLPPPGAPAIAVAGPVQPRAATTRCGCEIPGSLGEVSRAPWLFAGLAALGARRRVRRAGPRK